ncbi:hypothetical protein [Mycobacteroides abscessus]|uniref:hypothetical protein n=1 Tax=Mycobacteroides abscessus TaxID=36809 RepID=UPI00092C76D2|nr:hypothetical protein [Mycobacteroides abscessus]MBN7333054.1 hypothetical protein [Mycobacteroides abscessus subsp. abscessus]MDB2196235.1 hypothetical protein [Mycobacteroides abscessus subsp. abscessus]MDB2199829.1 hypothetical protein [Mycobacteroides abscessus subsp. abscessus]SHP46786.1 Uncharacterised protein [Mycobacteroides abscessus subsp. abscessus]SIE18253.1 Uncharacterised protein [Mycobacteroides abscessus subsp. abscessus]
MLVQTTQTITYLADIEDPTDDGIILTCINVAIAILALLTVGFGAKFAFDVWSEAKGRAAAIKGLREIGIGVLALEAFFGVLAALANYGSNIMSIIPGLG